MFKKKPQGETFFPEVDEERVSSTSNFIDSLLAQAQNDLEDANSLKVELQSQLGVIDEVKTRYVKMIGNVESAIQKLQKFLSFFSPTKLEE